jgi:hypothetical protein
VPSHRNPIEEAFAKIKNLLRKAAARSKEALVEAIAVALYLRSLPKTSGATSSMPDTVLQVNYCETCCRAFAHLFYSPNVVEEKFCELRFDGVLGSSLPVGGASPRRRPPELGSER